MAINFNESKTKENLMRAFAGESQARNRYTIAAETALKQKMYAIHRIFLFTADQEKAHAERFYDLLKNESGCNIQIDGAYPVDHHDSIEKLLKAAQHNEMEEFEDVYPEFARVAEEEGFLEVSLAFRGIAEVERIHGERFGKVAKLLEENRYYEREDDTAWMCLHCGHIQYGKLVPPMCPVCKHDRGYFIPADLAPYLAPELLKK